MTKATTKKGAKGWAKAADKGKAARAAAKAAQAKKKHHLGGVAGLVRQHRNHQTGTSIGLLNAAQAGLPQASTANLWALHCVDHDKHSYYPNKDAALLASRTPKAWCPACKALKKKVTK